MGRDGGGLRSAWAARVGARAALALLGMVTAMGARAEMLSEHGTFGGLEVDYRVVLPDGYDPDKAYPTILQFAGGPQTMRIVEARLRGDWEANAEKRGLIVVSPATPNGALFFKSADRIFPDFIEHIFKEFHVAGGKLHVTGHSNGGLSAFHVAALYPQYFVSVTGYPGLLDARRESDYNALKPLCIFMHVGGDDAGWKAAVRDEADFLKAHGYRVKFTVEPGQRHVLDVNRNGLADRLFDELAAARRGACGGAP